MYREIIKPKKEEYIIKIPKEYINQDVEILVLPFSLKIQNISEKLEGIDFSKYKINCFKNVDPVKFQRELRDEW